MLSKDLYTGSYFEKSASKAGALKALLAALGIGGLGALYARNGGLEADREAFYGAGVPVSANDTDKQQPGLLDYLSNSLNIGAANAVAHTGRFFNKKHKESYDNLVPQVYGPTPEEFSAIVKGIQDKSLAASDARDLLRQEALRGSSLGASDARDLLRQQEALRGSSLEASDARDLLRQQALRGSSLDASDLLDATRSGNMFESASRLMNDADAQQNSAANLGGYINQLSRNLMSGDPSQLDAVKRLQAQEQGKAALRNTKEDLGNLRSAAVEALRGSSLRASDARDLMRQEALRGSSLGASDARDLMRQEALRGSSLGASDILEGLRNQNLMERGLPFSNDTDAQQNSEGSLSGYLAQLGHDFSMASDPSQNPNLARAIRKQQFLRDLTSPINSLGDYLTSDSTSSKVNAIRNAQDAQQHSTGEETSSWKKSIWDFNRETPNNPIGKSTSTPRIPNVNNPEGEALMSAIAAKLTEGADSVGDTLAEAASREVEPRGSKKKDTE